jgi:hypothetical protein
MAMFEELIRLIIALLLMLSAHAAADEPPTEVVIAAPVYATPCQEDEAWVTVDYRDPVAIEDQAGVSRRCIPLDDLGL